MEPTTEVPHDSSTDPVLERRLQRLRVSLGSVLEETSIRIDWEAPGPTLLSIALGRRFVELLRFDALIRSRGEAEDVHRARSAVRKLRAILRGFRKFLDRGWADTLREDLRWLADQLGAVRDIDVALAALQARAESVPLTDAPYVAKTLEPMIRARAEAWRKLVATLQTDRYRALLDAVEDAVKTPRLAEAAEFTAGQIAEATLAKTAKRVRKAIRGAGSGVSPNELHHTRILARNGRYTAEACSCVLGKPARRLARRLSRVQDALGAVHDAVFIQDRLRESVGDGDARAPLVAGELLALEAAEGEKAQHSWESLRRRVLGRDWS